MALEGISGDNPCALEDAEDTLKNTLAVARVLVTEDSQAIFMQSCGDRIVSLIEGLPPALKGKYYSMYRTAGFDFSGPHPG